MCSRGGERVGRRQEQGKPQEQSRWNGRRWHGTSSVSVRMRSVAWVSFYFLLRPPCAVSWMPDLAAMPTRCLGGRRFCPRSPARRHVPNARLADLGGDRPPPLPHGRGRLFNIVVRTGAPPTLTSHRRRGGRRRRRASDRVHGGTLLRVFVRASRRQGGLAVPPVQCVRPKKLPVVEDFGAAYVPTVVMDHSPKSLIYASFTI